MLQMGSLKMRLTPESLRAQVVVGLEDCGAVTVRQAVPPRKTEAEINKILNVAFQCRNTELEPVIYLQSVSSMQWLSRICAENQV